MTDISPSPPPQQQQQHRRETRSSKSKEMVKAIPPSPALSQAELPPHGLPTGHMTDYYLQHHHQTSTAYYPQEQQVNMESIHPRSQPATRYSTPVPPRSIYQPTNQQLMQPYPQYSYPQPPQYDHSPYTFTDEYGTAVSTSFLGPGPAPFQFGGKYPGELTYYQSSQPYSTPATSPPSPSRHSEVRVTRSGTYPRGGKAVATSRPPPASSPPPKRKAAKDRPKAVKKSPHLSGPMSEITKDSHIPVVDIGSYVHRSTEERIREVATGKVPGKIKRPMNAFMLYRKAYQNRAKEWCSQHNHQIVSQVCGDSWPLEPEHIRAQFTEWAKIERDNHQKAHPSYKFTPSKPHKPKPSPGGKRQLEDDGPDDDPNDPEWRGAKRVRRLGTPLKEEEYHQPQSLYGGGGPYQSNRSAFHATNPGKPMPQPYDAHLGAGGHYYQTMQVRDGAVEHILYKKTPSPAMMHHHNQHHGGYEMSGYGPPPPPQQQMQHQSQQQHHHHHHPQYLDAQQHLQVQHQTAQYHGQRVDPSLLPAGTGELLELESYGHYPHQLDPAHHPGPWNEGQPVYLDHSTTFEIGQYGLPGDEFGDATALLVQPEQEKIFNQEPWQVLDSSSLAVEGDDWDKFGELPLEGAVSELDRK